jgi:hypothetical protein
VRNACPSARQSPISDSRHPPCSLACSTLSNRTYGKDICNWTGLNKDQRREDAEVNIDVAEGEDQTEGVVEEMKVEQEEGIVGQAISVAQGEEAASVEEKMTNSSA